VMYVYMCDWCVYVVYLCVFLKGVCVLGMCIYEGFCV